jgi:hypothetical protein
VSRYTVHFEGVGRDKRSWTATMRELSFKSLVASVRKHRALMSSDISFWVNEAETEGQVFVGFGRQVGTFRVEGGGT